MTCNLQIELLNEPLEIIDGIKSCWGQITINEFTEKFPMPLEWWNIDDYQRQWKLGMNRIKNSNNSCLVVAIQDMTKRPLIDWWKIYKIDNQLIIRNQMLFGKNLTNLLKGKNFTVDNCFQLIPPLTKNDTASEWVVNLDNCK